MSRGPGRDVNVVDGALIKPLIVLSLPIIATNLLQVGYNIADTFWVGRLGQDAVSAISFSWAIVFLIITLAGGFAVAGTVLVAQNKGAGNLETVDHVAGQTIGFVIAVSAVLSVLGYVLAPWLLSLVGAVPGTTVFDLSVEYTRTIFLGIPFVFGFFIFQSLLQGWGDTRTPFYLMLFGVVLNVLIDPIFILGFEDNVLFEALGLDALQASLFAATGFAGFGVQGAAFATILSRGLGAIIAFGLLLSGYVGLQPVVSDFWPKRETVREIIRIGAPASVEQSTTSLSVTILTALVAIAGAEAVAAYGIGSRLVTLVVLPALGFARGTETVVGQNLGANQADRARRAVLAAAGLIAIVLAGFSLAALAYAETLTAVFITGPDSGIVIEMGGDFLRIVGASFVFLGVFQIVQGGFRGSGSTRLAMVFSILGLLVIRIPAAYLGLTWFGLGETGVWYGIALSNVVIAVVVLGWFFRGTWTENVLDERPDPSAVQD